MNTCIDLIEDVKPIVKVGDNCIVIPTLLAMIAKIRNILLSGKTFGIYFYALTNPDGIPLNINFCHFLSLCPYQVFEENIRVV